MATTKAPQAQAPETDQQVTDDPGYADGIVARLTEHFLSSAPLPGYEDRPLTVARFYRLYRHIIAEGYGQG